MGLHQSFICLKKEYKCRISFVKANTKKNPYLRCIHNYTYYRSEITQESTKKC